VSLRTATAVEGARLAPVPRVTLQSIADEVGVSRMTVSNAFSRPDQLSAGLRERILNAADELGYVGPDPAARALARGRVGSVGMLLTEPMSTALQDQVATTFVAAVTDALAHRGVALTVLTPATDQWVPARDVAMDGALVYMCGEASAELGWLRRRGIPVVGVDQPALPGVPAVGIDDQAGARAAADHLVELGHRRIAILTLGSGGRTGVASGDVEVYGHAASERLAGWTSVLEVAGIEPLVALSLYRSSESTYAVARELLEAEARPTAILCFSDAFAVQVLRAARDVGLSVPGDLSVVGYDDSPLARQVDPQLTTVRQDLAAKAEAAVAALTVALAAQKNDQPPAETATLLPTELVVRDSTGPAPA
jgi:DNA-binding LacI/PurR family transcriptional regulator